MAQLRHDIIPVTLDEAKALAALIRGLLAGRGFVLDQLAHLSGRLSTEDFGSRVELYCNRRRGTDNELRLAMRVLQKLTGWELDPSVWAEALNRDVEDVRGV